MSMKKPVVLILVLVSMACLLFVGCPNPGGGGGGGGGGAGADFDSSQYYTKSEVDGLISTLTNTLTNLVKNNLPTDYFPYSLSIDHLTVSNTTYATGQTISGITSGMVGALYRVTSNCGSTKTFEIALGDGSTVQDAWVTLDPGETEFVYVSFKGLGSTPKWFIPFGAAIGDDLGVKAVLVFRDGTM